MKTTHKNFLLIFSIMILFTSCKEKSLVKEASQASSSVDEVVSVQGTDNMPVEEDLLRNAGLDGDIETVKEMIARNVNVNALDQDGRSALMFASFNGHLEIVRTLKEKGAKINLQDYVGRTALMFASSGKFPETVKFLLENEADPNLIDREENFTAIMFAAAEGNMEVVKILLTYGADPNLKDVDGETAELFARTNGHLEVADFLKEWTEK
ncbi:MAG: ankyrin repeat domain-containing protein [Bacteroidales bacterium]|nr:ankyrin repeat domain-containing protein [Bacteroidales bacterium]MCF8389085.1 ankyrin repeat domain-containing protein [Bacteroidales bacterium]